MRRACPSYFISFPVILIILMIVVIVRRTDRCRACQISSTQALSLLATQVSQVLRSQVLSFLSSFRRPQTPNDQVGRRIGDRTRDPLGGLKSDECIEDGASDPSRTGVLEGSWPPNTDRADGSGLRELPEPPRQACGAPEHFKQPSSSLHGPHFEPPKTPKCPSSLPASFQTTEPPNVRRFRELATPMIL